MKILISLFFLIPLFYVATGQRTDSRLQHSLENAIKGFHGNIGIYVKNLKNHKTVSINADTIFPTASMVKIPILIGIMAKINEGQFNYHQELTYSDSILYPGVDILGSFKNAEKIELSKVMMLSLTMSDNTASLWLQNLAGKGTRINNLLDSLGFVNTRVNSRTPGRQTNQATYGWGQTTPREMAELMGKIVDGEVISKDKSAQMLRLLGRNYWDEAGISSIPADVFVADKNGSLDQLRSEVMFVNGKGARYIVCICTNNNLDQTWLPSNEAWTLTRNLSRIIWKHYSKE